MAMDPLRLIFKVLKSITWNLKSINTPFDYIYSPAKFLGLAPQILKDAPTLPDYDLYNLRNNDLFQWPDFNVKYDKLENLKKVSHALQSINNEWKVGQGDEKKTDSEFRLTNESMKKVFAYNNEVYDFSNNMANPLKKAWGHKGIKRFAVSPNKNVALKLSVIDSPTLEVSVFQAVRRSVYIGPKAYSHVDGPNIEVYHDLNFRSVEQKIDITHGEADIWYLGLRKFNRVDKNKPLTINSYERKKDGAIPQVWTHSAGVYAIALVTRKPVPKVSILKRLVNEVIATEDSPEALFEIRPKHANTDEKAAMIMATPTLGIFGVENPGPKDESSDGIYNDSVINYNTPDEVSEGPRQPNTEYSTNLYAKSEVKDISGCWDEFLPRSDRYPESKIFSKEKSGIFGIIGGKKAVVTSEPVTPPVPNGEDGLEIFGRTLLLGANKKNNKNKWESQLLMKEEEIRLTVLNHLGRETGIVITPDGVSILVNGNVGYTLHRPTSNDRAFEHKFYTRRDDKPITFNWFSVDFPKHYLGQEQGGDKHFSLTHDIPAQCSLFKNLNIRWY